MFNSKELSVRKDVKELDYWRKQLRNISPYLDLNTDRPRKSLNATNLSAESVGNSALYTLPHSEAIALKKVAEKNKVTLQTLLFCALQVLLYRYTQQADLLVGYENVQEQSRLTILPIRMMISSKLTFAELLTNAKQIISEANKYSHLSLSILAQTLREEDKDFSIDILSQIVFKFNRALTTEKAPLVAGRSTTELLLNVTESEHLAYRFKYFLSLYNESTIQRLSDNYHQLLKSIIDNPDVELDRLSLISTAEAERVLFTWNQTQVEFESASQCVHQLFETRAKANSEAIALICGEQQLTYGELNERANQLARCLQSRGLKPGSLVGLCIERSLQMVVGVLAILKAGGAYVPLDINNPAARLAFILEDAQIKVLLTQSSLSSKLPARIAETIFLDGDRSIADYDSANLNLNVSAEDLAHIVYTSGSTGKPKGVMLTHGNLSHYVTSLQQAWNITPEDIYLHRGSIALIVSARQLLMPLAQGATAVIVTKAEMRNPLEFFELIKRRNVTIVDHVPSFWRNFWGILERQTDSDRQNLLNNRVRLVAAGGEQVTPEIYQCWRKIFDADVQLANIYGQTEGTGVVTIYPIPTQLDTRFKSLPVGRPIPNMQVYLLDDRLQPVPIGVTAEIHISGAGVAKGYLNRSELTQEKFVSNPYNQGERLYKTGDLGCYLADGSIQFLGRADRQVNIQGLRIELGEIEAVLSQSDLVIEAAITVKTNNLGETLAAYIVPKDQEVTVELLRDYLKSELPAYMIPNTFSFLDVFPLTTSGKVDRRALAALSDSEPSTSPLTEDPIAAEIVKMLQDILGIDTITAEDNFIELGGNSLLAARLVAELVDKYDRQISVAEVFGAATPASLAELLRSPQSKSLPPCCVPIKQGDSELTIFGIHNLGYGLEFYRPLAKYLDAEVSLYGLSAALSDEPETPHFRDVVNSAKYYVRQIQQIQERGPYHLMGVSFGGLVAYETAQILRSQGEEVKFLGLLDTYFPHVNGLYKPSLNQRVSRHLEKISNDGFSHVFDRLQWRANATKDYLRYSLSKIAWVRNNLVDRTGRNFAQTIYIEQKKEQEKVNQDYAIQPYQDAVHMFRATDDIDPKLEWRKLVRGELYIHDVPGEHLGILQEPNVKVLAAEISSVLNEGVDE